MSEVADVLNKAADLIEQRGLHKLSFVSEGKECSFCTEGAIMAAAGFEVTHYSDAGVNFFSLEALDARTTPGSVVNKAIAAVRFVVEDQVPDWNDAPNITQADVVRTLREVAANV